MRTGLAPIGRGRSLSFAVAGEAKGRPPVLLNRPLGGSMVLWGDFATRLSASFQLVLFDPLGVGLSSALPLPHTTRAMAGDAVALLDFLGIARAHVFGLSLGGMVASWIALDAPGRLDRLVLASTLPRAGAVSHRVRRHIAPLARAFLRHGAGVEVALVRDILSPEFLREAPGRVREIERLVRRFPTTPATLALLALAAARHDVSHLLERIEARTLLLFGDRDPIAGSVAREELAHGIPRAAVEIVAGAGHDLSLERPVELAARVAEELSP